MNYFIVLHPPTPNGRLHLGHLGGVYLPIDIIARRVRQLGHHVAVLGISDALDSFVQLGCFPGESTWDAARRFHMGIRDDLQSSLIDFSDFISPVSSYHQDQYIKTHRELFLLLRKAGKVEYKNDPFYEDMSNTPISGCMLFGTCPNCNNGVAGFICEACGDIIAPSRLLNVERRGGGTLAQKFGLSPFLTLSDRSRDILSARLLQMNMATQLKQAPLKFLGSSETSIRLGYRGSHGIPIDTSDSQNLIFNYSGFADYVFLGEIARDYFGFAENPLSATSRDVVISSFGADNALSALIFESAVALESGIWRPFDIMLPCPLLKFEGKKFSTSRRHGIWIKDLEKCSTLDIDSLRLFLSSSRTDFDLSVNDIVNFQNTGQCRALANMINQSSASLKPEKSSSTRVSSLGDFCRSYLEQEFRLHLSSADYSAALFKWQKLRSEHCINDIEFLFGTAVLGYPIIPTIALHVWRHLGFSDLPHVLNDISIVPTRKHVLWDLPFSLKDELEAAAHRGSHEA